MAEKNIEIKISAVGGDQAAAEIGKLSAEMRAGEAAARKFAEELESEAREKAAIARKKEMAIGISAITAAAAAAGQTLRQVAEAVDSIDIEALREMDSIMADQVESAKSWAAALKDPIGALLKLTTGETVASAFAGMNEQLELTAEQHAAAIDRLISGGIKQKDELKALTDAIKASNEILDAKDAADAKARDRADAAAIREGAPKEDVAAQRAEYDAAKQIEAINRRLDPAISATNDAWDNLDQAKRNAAAVASDPEAKREDQEAARKQVADMQAEFDQARRELATAKAVAAEQRRGVREGASLAIEGFSSDKEKRLQGEQAEKDRKAAEEKKRADSEAARARLDGAEGDLNTTARGDAAKFQNAGRRVGGKLGDTLQGIGDKLSDGTSEKEIAALRAQFVAATQGLGGETIAAMREMLATQHDQAKQIEVLRSQIKNARNGR